MIIFFFASAGASAAYLTETWPIEIRTGATAIAYTFALTWESVLTSAVSASPMCFV